jgi:hypothetical protein
MSQYLVAVLMDSRSLYISGIGCTLEVSSYVLICFASNANRTRGVPSTSARQGSDVECSISQGCFDSRQVYDSVERTIISSNELVSQSRRWFPGMRGSNDRYFSGV